MCGIAQLPVFISLGNCLTGCFPELFSVWGYKFELFLRIVVVEMYFKVREKEKKGKKKRKKKGNKKEDKADKTNIYKN